MKRLLKNPQTIQMLKQIPQNMLPSTLKNPIFLKNINSILISYRPNAKDFGPLFQYIRKYSPAIRYYNPQLKFERLLIEEGPVIPKIRLSLKNQDTIQIDPSIMKTPQQLHQKIKSINELLQLKIAQ